MQTCKKRIFHLNFIVLIYTLHCVTLFRRNYWNNNGECCEVLAITLSALFVNSCTFHTARSSSQKSFIKMFRHLFVRDIIEGMRIKSTQENVAPMKKITKLTWVHAIPRMGAGIGNKYLYILHLALLSYLI